jgi:DinB family protein
MTLRPHLAADRLEASGAALAALARSAGPELARWRPGEGRWALVEVVAHLADEERFDFRARFDLLVGKHREEPFAPIDPAGWVAARRYIELELDVALEDFLAERRHSLAWLRGLGAPDLSPARSLPSGGDLSAGDVLASWVAHDLLHLRQMARILHARAAADAAPHGVGYAGSW